MHAPRHSLLTLALLVAAVAPATTASAASRPPIKDCGDVATIDKDQVFIGAITAQGATCKNARAIARTVARSARCKRQGSCRARTFTCLLAKAGKELTLVHCEGAGQTAFVRFEFGS